MRRIDGHKAKTATFFILLKEEAGGPTRKRRKRMGRKMTSAVEWSAISAFTRGEKPSLLSCPQHFLLFPIIKCPSFFILNFKNIHFILFPLRFSRLMTGSKPKIKESISWNFHTSSSHIWKVGNR